MIRLEWNQRKGSQKMNSNRTLIWTGTLSRVHQQLGNTNLFQLYIISSNWLTIEKKACYKFPLKSTGIDKFIIWTKSFVAALTQLLELLLFSEFGAEPLLTESYFVYFFVIWNGNFEVNWLWLELTSSCGCFMMRDENLVLGVGWD